MENAVSILLRKDGVIVPYFSIKKLENGVLLNGHYFVPYCEIERI